MPSAMHLRAAEDWRGSRIARRFMLAAVLTPSAATAGTNLIGLRHVAGQPEVFISRLRVHYHHSAATISAVSALGWKRGTVSGGTTMTAADIPKCDTAAPNATLEVLTGSVTTSAEANQYLLTHPAPTAATGSLGTNVNDDWTARDLSERIRLTGAEAIFLELVGAYDTDLRVHLLAVWEEVTN
jgi:hypothetical protein